MARSKQAPGGNGPTATEPSGEPGNTGAGPGASAARSEYGTQDYQLLPDFGLRHYSFPDAALLAAVDMFLSGEVRGIGIEPDYYDVDAEKVRRALRPLREKLLAALVRSLEARQLEAIVLRRNLDDGKPVPAHCFIDIKSLVEWLEVYGYSRGDFIAEIQQSTMESPWKVASEVAEDRAQLRYGSRFISRRSRTFPVDEDDALASIVDLRRELDAVRLHVAQLEQEKAAGRGRGDGLATRQRRTLLTVIAALCRKARIDPMGRGAAVTIAAATAELGVPVSDDSIRAILQDIPDAIESRTR